MKKVLASLLAVYSFANGQMPPLQGPLPGAATPPQTTAASPPQTVSQPPVTPPPPQSTAAASTAAPVQTTTTTAAPQPVTTQYINPYCPANAGVAKPTGWGRIDEACVYSNQVASDWQGRLRCNDFSCCKCAQINCGFQGYPCQQVQFGDSGAVGVKSINVNGVDAYGYVGSSGAILECNGLESCKETFIRGNYLQRGQCSGDFGCQQAQIIVYNPAPNFLWQCNGLMACLDLSLEIIIGTAGQQCPPMGSGQIHEINAIEFNGQQAAQNARLTIRNYGCDQVLIKNLECMNPTACPNTIFQLEGNIVIQKCDLQGMRNLNNLPAALRGCAMGLSQQQPFLPNPINPGLPTFPQLPVATQPPLVTTTTTQQPLPSYPVPTQPVPSYPAPTQPVPSFPQLPLSTQPPLVTTTTTTQAPLPSYPQQPIYPQPVPTQPMVPVVPQVSQPPQPTQPALGLLTSSNQQLKCDNSKTFCGGQAFTIDARQNFVLECAAIGACSQMSLTLNVGFDPVTMLPVDKLDSLKFTNTNAGTGATIYINNVQGPYAQPVKLGDIRCEKPASCVGLTVIAGNMVDIWSTNVDCQQAFYCSGCTIKQGTVERPCNFGSAQNTVMYPSYPSYPFQAQAQPVSYSFPNAYV